MTFQIYATRQGVYSVDRDGHLVALIVREEHGHWFAYRARRIGWETRITEPRGVQVTSDLHHHDRLIPRIEALIA